MWPALSWTLFFLTAVWAGKSSYWVQIKTEHTVSSIGSVILDLGYNVTD